MLKHIIILKCDIKLARYRNQLERIYNSTAKCFDNVKPGCFNFSPPSKMSHGMTSVKHSDFDETSLNDSKLCHEL